MSTSVPQVSWINMDYDYEETYDPNEKLSLPRKIGRIIKYILYAVAIIYVGLLCLRMFSSGDTKIAKTFVWTDKAIEAYENDPSSFIVKAINIPEFYSDGGEFYISNARFVESIGQFQATVRYNNSVIKTIMSEYGLGSEPAGETFVFTVTDNLGNLYTEYEFVKDEKNVLNYRRVVFSDIDMTNISTLTLNIYFIGDVTLSAPYATLPLYNALKPSPLFNIKKELYKNGSATEGLMHRPGYQINDEPIKTEAGDSVTETENTGN